MEGNTAILDEIVLDLIIIGGGPAGLSAAINASAEGLTTLLLEGSERFGGQAGTSSRIENYLGFTQGLSGPELARLAVDQASRLGAFLEHSRQVVEVRPEGQYWKVICANGQQYVARAVLVTTGARWRRLDVPGAAGSRTLVYNATPEVLESFSGQPVAVIGAANSAGQAALHLADQGAEVTVLARRTLSAAMSHYLVERILEHPGMRALEHTQVRAVADGVDGGTLQLSSGAQLDVAAAFVYIGSEPTPSPFLAGHATTDAKGFLVTAGSGSFAVAGAPGLFAAGDIRSGSRKRVATATGEGATATAEVWTYVRETLASERERPAPVRAYA
jgi:thioredoxin reductase (NADPH)